MPTNRNKARGASKAPPKAPPEASPNEEKRTRRLKWWDSGSSARPRCHDEYLSEIPADVRVQMDATIRRYLDGVLRRQDIDHLGKGVYEFRRRKGSNHYRILFFVWGDYVVALTAFYKNQQQTPKADLDRALRRKAAWEALHGDPPANSH